MNTLESGASVGRYRVLQFLGSGAMGEVYLAEDPQIERRLAIKTVRLVGRPQEIEDRKRRLLREARAAGRLLHPNVVTLFDAGEQEGLLFLAFELVEGTDLAARLEAGPALSLREVLRMVRQVADALDYAHRQGIVHRDIKPSNVLLDNAGRVKVADFGIAKVAGQSTELTVAGSVMGSPQYLSPEQIRGEELDGRTDIFSLGVVLYELLSTQRPFNGETITTLVYQILHMEPPPISELRAVPERLESLLRRMLAKSRDERFATAGEVSAEIAAVERELSDETLSAPATNLPLEPTRVMTRRTTEGARQAAASAPPPIVPAPSLPVVPPPPPSAAAAVRGGRGPGLALAIAAGVLFLVVAAAAAGWFLFFRKEEGPTLAETSPPDGQTAPVAGPGAAMPRAPETGSDPEPVSPPASALPSSTSPDTPASREARETREPGNTAQESAPREEPPLPRVRAEEAPAQGDAPPRPRDRVPVLPPPAGPPEAQRPRVEETAPGPSAEARPGGTSPAAPADEPAPDPGPAPDQVLRSGLELAFRITPPDAFVLVDGRSIGRAAEWNGLKGNRTYTLPDAGEHRIKIRSQGMREHRILVQASESAGVTPVTVRLRPLGGEEADVTDLQEIRVREAVGFRVTPPGAVVLVDGQPRGQAKRFAGRLGMPGTWLRLPPGRHRISIVAPGLERRDFSVDVTPGAEKERDHIEVRLVPGGGP